MADKSITHIREPIWRGVEVKEISTLCGIKEGSSISWEHMQEGYDETNLGVKRHIKFLELCDDCYEDFKKQHDPYADDFNDRF